MQNDTTGMNMLNLEQESCPVVSQNITKRINNKTLSNGASTSCSISTGTYNEVCNETESVILRGDASNNNSSEHEVLEKSVSLFLNHEQLADTLQQLPVDSKEFLIFASCFGTKLDIFILKHFCNNNSELFLYHCKVLASQGLVEKCNIQDDDDCLWKFPHQIIIKAAYDMIQVAERNTFHYKIGRKLWQQLAVDEIDQYIFVLVDQLLFGIEIIKEKGDIKEIAAVSKLLLRAGEKSVQSSDFVNASNYLSHGISLLDDHSWREEYELCLSIYNAAAEVAYCSGDFDHANSLVNITLRNAQLFEHKIQAYVTKIFSIGTSGNFAAAIDTGIFVLSRLGENLPVHPTKARMLREIMRIKRKLIFQSDDSILSLPILHDSRITSVMKILNAMFSFAYIDSIELGGFIGLRMLYYTLLYGQSVMSPLGFIVYGVIVSRRHIDDGVRLGRLGYQMFARQNVTQWTGRVYFLYFGLIHSLKMPLQETIANLKYGYSTALEKGDIEYAFFCGTFFLYARLEISTLHVLKTDMVTIRDRMKTLHQQHSFAMTKLLETLLGFLLCEEKTEGTRYDPTLVDDNAFQFDEIVMETIRPWTFFGPMMIHFLFGNIDKAYRHVRILLKYITKSPSPIMKTFHALVLFYVGLVATEHWRQCRSGLKDAKKCLKRLRILAKHSPCNSLGKLYLLEAEVESLKRDDSSAFSKYISAIGVTKESGFLTETALSYELAAKFLLSKGENQTAESFYENAIMQYGIWGSKPKVLHLQKQIGFHFSSQIDMNSSVINT